METRRCQKWLCRPAWAGHVAQMHSYMSVGALACPLPPACHACLSACPPAQPPTAKGICLPHCRPSIQRYPVSTLPLLQRRLPSHGAAGVLCGWLTHHHRTGALSHVACMLPACCLVIGLACERSCSAALCGHALPQLPQLPCCLCSVCAGRRAGDHHPPMGRHTVASLLMPHPASFLPCHAGRRADHRHPQRFNRLQHVGRWAL